MFASRMRLGFSRSSTNSNLLGGVALLRAWSHDGDTAKLDLARRVFNWSVSKARPDGSWLYGVGKRYAWSDNFHTAYVIDCLAEARNLCGDELVPSEVFERSMNYWQSTFFLAERYAAVLQRSHVPSGYPVRRSGD